MDVPNVIITSFSETYDAENLIKDILQVQELPKELQVECYPKPTKTFLWRFETKYYTTEVHLCSVSDDQLSSSDVILKNMQAVIVYFDSQKESEFNRAQQLHSQINENEPDIRLLVCNNCSDNSTVTKTTIQSWCLENGYELVELNPDEPSEIDDEFAETIGKERIIQALHSHVWPNLVMKEKVLNCGIKMENTKSCCRDALNSSNSECVCTISKDENEASGNLNPTLKEEDLEAVLKNLDSDDDQTFESLFEKFQIIKDNAKNMDFHERKAYAEQVAVTFWRAIGGDEDEITDESTEEIPESSASSDINFAM